MEQNLAKETQLFNLQINGKNQQYQPSKPNSRTTKQGEYNKTNSAGKGCFECGRTNHLAKDCRAPQWDREKYKSRVNNRIRNRTGKQY